MKRRTSQAPFVQKVVRNVYIVLSKNIITIHTETNIGIFVEERWWGSTSSFGLYREAPLERGTFFRFQVYERVGKSVISVCKDPKGQVTK